MKYGRWTVIGESFIRGTRRFVPCRCDCGTERTVLLTELRMGHSASCGCARRVNGKQRDWRRYRKSNEYGRLHWRVRKVRGRAPSYLCVRCAENGRDTQAREWATIHGADGTDPWADYVPLCKPCHIAYDGPPPARRGEDKPGCKLDEQAVRHIRLVTADDRSRAALLALAAKYGVAERTVRSVRERTKWAWLD